MVLCELIRTNLRMLVRSKGAAVALIIAPLLLMVVAAMAFDSQNTYDLTIGAYAQAYSKDANQFIHNLEENNFKVSRFRESTQCLDDLKLGTIVACLIFTKQTDEVAIYIDSSKLNLVDSLMSLMARQLSEQSSISGANITANLLQRMEDARAGLEESRPVIVSLTTHNEQSTQKVNTMLSSLNALSLKINQSLESAVLQSEDNKFIEWLTDLSSMVNELLMEYSNAMDSLKEELGSVAMPEADKQNLLTIIQQGEDGLKDLKQRLDIGAKISEKDLENVLELTSQTLNTLQNIETELDSLQNFRSTSVNNLREIRGALDQNLLKFIQLQNSLNKIDKSISGVQIEDPQDLLAPLKVRVEPITSTTKRFQLLFPSLLVMVIMFASILIGASLMVMHKTSPVAKRNKTFHINKRTFEAAILGATLVVVALQTLAIFTIGLFFFGMDLVVVLPAALAVTLIVAGAFSMIGLVLGAFFAKETTAIFSGVLGSGFLLMFSDLILPLEAFPAAVRAVMMYNPLVLGMNALKRVILFHVSVTFVLESLAVLAGYMAICALVLVIINRTHKKHFKSSRIPSSK